MYDVLLERHAERDLKPLPAIAFRRIIAAIQLLADDPRPAGCKKLVGSQRDWRIRIGEYRVLFEIDDTEQIVRVMRVRHRRDAYRG